ncbi:MAG: RHS repeat-associated core domain-containing protein, partial [Gammaproteobacteria bacterium]
ASYDANNRLTQWGAKTLSYDADGNLTGDGTNTYTWNTRNQLMSLSGGSTGSFVYDALGRRESKTIGGTGTNFLYDGFNIEQELNGSTPIANYLTGTGTDEVYSRADSVGTRNYLTDGLGSSLALTDNTGVIQTSYSYDPYGNTTLSGQTNANALQYTGRENDGTGLYYNRARYYSALYGRFISEDPLGLLAGVNEYAYSESDPINLEDPFGLDPIQVPFDPFTLSSQDLQAMQVQAAAEQQKEATQYLAFQAKANPIKCLFMNFKNEFNANSNGFQREFGAVGTVTSLGKFVTHVSVAAGLKGTAFTANTTAQVYSLANDLNGARALEGIGTAAEYGSGVGEGFLIIDTYFDALDFAYT